MKKKVLFITHKFPPSTGGMEKFSFELFQGINKSNNNIILAYTGKESKLLWFLRLKSRVKQVIDRHPEIGLIHLNDGLMATFGTWLKKTYSLPVVVTLHGLDIVFPLPYFQKKIVPRLNCYDGFACVSEATKNAAQLRGIDPDKIRVILNGVDHQLFSSPEKKELQEELKKRYNLENKILFIGLGRSVKRKGYSWFVKEVLPGLSDNVKFIMCGPDKKYNGNFYRKLFPDKWVTHFELMLGLPSDERDLQNLAKKHPERFIKTGYLPFEEIVQLMKISKKFVMPNVEVEGDMEGFGLVALEACLAGCMVYASKIDGITSAIIGNKNGLLIESQNAEAWIEILNQYSKHECELAQYQKYTLENYSWDIMCKAYEEWFSTF